MTADRQHLRPRLAVGAGGSDVGMRRCVGWLAPYVDFVDTVGGSDGLLLEAAAGFEAGARGEEESDAPGEPAVMVVDWLAGPEMRHHFLTRLFAFAELRGMGPAPRTTALADFQRRNKHLLMTSDQGAMRALGTIAGRGDGSAGRYAAYRACFHGALAQLPERGAYFNALMHMYGHFKRRLDAAERKRFYARLKAFERGELLLHAVMDVIRGWCARFGYDYLADQSLFEPYPRELKAAPKLQ